MEFKHQLVRVLLIALVAAAGATGCGSAGGGGGGGATLAGTWDLTASNTQSSGTLILDDKTFNLSIGNYTFLMHVTDAAADLTWKAPYDGISNIDTKRVPAPLNLGAIPLPLGGDWTFSSPGSTEGCLGSARASGWTGSCTQVNADNPVVSLYERSAHAARTETRDSMFGDLGGVWTVANDSGSSGAHVTATFEGASLRATAFHTADESQPDRGVTLDFSDGLASGSLMSGVEFSARRR